jgi:putative transposase
MEAAVVERRQAVVARLADLRRDGRLSPATVRAAASSLGVHHRTVWRWLAAGEYAPEHRESRALTDEAIEAIYQAGGRPTVAWRALRERGAVVPSHPVFCRAVRRDLSPAELAYAREGEHGRRRYEVYRRWEPRARNEVWEADHAQSDVEVLPLRGVRRVRQWLTVVGFSRLVMGWALSLQPTSAEVLAVLREAIVLDPDRGPWGAVPQLVRSDGGREFLACAVSRAAAEVRFAALPTASYWPYQKGKLERLQCATAPCCIPGIAGRNSKEGSWV